jgi:hypothetical protein
MTPLRCLRAYSLLALALLLSPVRVRGASYLPLADKDLARQAPVIVRARVIGQETRVAKAEQQEIVLTRTSFEPLEVFKGSIPSTSFSVELPGGEAEDFSYWIPGTPAFALKDEVILFLSPVEPGEDGQFRLTELGLSRFDIVTDAAGRRFAVRPAFAPAEDDVLAARDHVVPAREGTRHPLRDAESFEDSLRRAGAGETLLPVSYSSPEWPTGTSDAVSPRWVNIGGTEGGNRLYRWFWDTGRSPAARVVAVGTQSGLSDGSDGLAAVENSAVQWSGVAGASVLYSPTSGSAQVVVNLDVASNSSYWSEPMSCTSGGVIGLGGPGPSYSAGSFKGDANYSAVTSGAVWMRKVTGGCYSWRTFQSAVLHEVGHTLGLGHADLATSTHSKTSPLDHSSAVMASAVPYTTPSTPQADDIAAILWLYGAAVSPPAIPDRPRPVLSTRRPRLEATGLDLDP